MKQVFSVALAMAAQVAHARLQTFQMDNGWQVRFDADDCSLKVDKIVQGQGTSHVTVFEADEHMLSVGRGDIDDYTVMTSGNIERFPKRGSKSAVMMCDESSITNSTSSFNVTGKIVIHEADERNEAVTTDFTMKLDAEDSHRLKFKAEALEAYSAENDTNYLSMTYHSPIDEEIYGMGLQYSEWNFKGKIVPLISEEAGVGRGIQPITAVQNKNGGGGGLSTTSYAPAAQYITNKQRGMIFDSRSTGIAFFDGTLSTEMLYWHETGISGTIMWGEDPLALAQTLSKTVGTMRPLPEWALKGAIVGIVGGQEFVDEKYAMMKAGGLPMCGIWMQDWVGEHTYPEGTRLIWNWQLKRDYYYDWDRMVTDWEMDGVRPLIYINPYI